MPASEIIATTAMTSAIMHVGYASRVARTSKTDRL
jgi:hypothetical protein